MSQGLLSPNWMHYYLSQLSKEFERCSLTTKDAWTGKEWVPGESVLSMVEEDQLLEITNDGGLKSRFKSPSNLHTF